MSIPEPTKVYDFNHGVASGYQDVAVAHWQLMFPRIEEATRKLESTYVAVVEDRSSLRCDDRYLGRWRNGGHHVGAMQVARDSLMTVQGLLERGELAMAALYPMLRAVIENSSLAIYLLAPTDRDERLRRAYLVSDDDARLQAAFAATMGKVDADESHEATTVEIRGLIAMRPSMGNRDALKFSRVSYTEIVKVASVAIDADPMVPSDPRMPLLGWWQLLSGLSHGKAWAMIAALERSDAIPDVENETALVKLSTSPAVISLALQRSVEALEAALRLYGQRSTAFTAQPEDASEPPTQTYVQLRAAGLVP